jgi:spermidine/putrescine transport system ATP-binding protein
MLELADLTVTYGDLTAVDGVSLDVRDGELCCLLGPSGSGKSTLLRAVAGFETPDRGRVRIDGRDVTDVPPHRRPTSMVFQDWALFPTKSVIENVAFGPKMRGVGRRDRRAAAREALELVEMTDYAGADPTDLSGGQRQRVALARSLVVEPDLLLLDEPLSSLDRGLRETMQVELKRIHDRVETTMLYVTHDQNEAFTLGDRLGVMDDGELVQVGTPEAVYTDPVDRFVESFLGSPNLLDCRVVDVDGGATLETPLGVRVPAPIDTDGLAPGDGLVVSLRPERLSVTAEAAPATDGGAGASVPATVVERVYRGSDVRLRLSAGEAELFVERPIDAGGGLAAGDEVRVRWAPEAATYFDASGARRR